MNVELTLQLPPAGWDLLSTAPVGQNCGNAGAEMEVSIRMQSLILHLRSRMPLGNNVQSFLYLPRSQTGYRIVRKT